MKKFVGFLAIMAMSLALWSQTYFTESFEDPWTGSPAAPPNWTQVNIAGTDTEMWDRLTWDGSAWTGGTSNGTKPNGTAFGTAVAHFNDFNCYSGNVRRLISPDINLSTATNPRLTFYYYYPTGAAKLNVYASADGGTNWTLLGTVGATGTTWMKQIFSLSDFKVSNAKIALEVFAAYSSHDVWLDYVVVEESPAPMSGVYTIDNTQATGGTNFQSFTDAINALNDRGISGPVTFNVIAGQEFTEDPPAITVASAVDKPVVFQKFGDGNKPVLKPTGTTGTSDFGFRINGSDYITFDGIDITIATGAAVEYGFYLTGGVKNTTIKNSKITLNKLNTNSIGIYVQSNATSPETTNDNIWIYGDTIIDVAKAVKFYGMSATYPDLNNTITNCLMSDIGALTVTGGLVEVDFQNNLIITNNIITPNTGTFTSTSAIAVISSTIGACLNAQIIDNTINGIKLNTANEVAGIRVTSNITGTIANNTINDILNIYSTNTTAAFASGINVSIQSGGTLIINNNTINNIQCAKYDARGILTGGSGNAVISGNIVSNVATQRASAGAAGIRVQNSGTSNIFRNIVYDIKNNTVEATAASGFVYGIDVNGGSIVNVYNNFVYGLSTTNSNAIPGVRGIALRSGTTINIYFNTVYIDFVSSVNVTASAAFYITGGPTTMNAYNNIFINKTDVSTGTVAAALWSTATSATGKYNGNNNLYYAGTPSAKNVIFREGSNVYQTLQDFKNYLGTKEQQSITQDVSFVNTTTFPYDLHIDPTVPTKVESAGIPIALVTEDIDGEPRNATTPDIGADEGNFILLDETPPTITFTPLANTSSTSARQLVVTITDISGVAAAPNDPVLYYRIKTAGTWGAWTFVNATTVNGNDYTFEFGEGVQTGDSVQYFVVAQDAIGNVGAYPGTGAVLTANPPRMTTPPTNPLAYKIVLPISGVKTVGTGGDFASLSAASIALFNDYELVGPLTLQLISSTYDEAVVFANYPGISATNTVTIKPAPGVQATINASTQMYGVAFDGAQYITIDGSNSENGTTRDLIINNTYTGGTFNFPVGLFNGASNITIKNCVIVGTPSVSSSYGVFLNASFGGYNNVVIENNHIKNVKVGMQFVGVSGNWSYNGVIRNNIIGDSTQFIPSGGILAEYVDNLKIEGNDIFGQIDGNTNTTQYGISVINDAKNLIIEGNKIHDFYYNGTAGYGAQGIRISVTDVATEKIIRNNFIWNIKGDGDAIGASGINWIPAGILLQNGGNFKIYHNTVNMIGNVLGSSYNGNSACVNINNSVTDVWIKNNILKNSQTGTGSNKTYAIASRAAATIFTELDNNVYWVDGTGPNVGWINGTDYATLTDWQTATGKDAGSLTTQPFFVSDVNLHIDAANTNNCAISNIFPNIGVNNDIDGDVRQAFVDPGADEWQATQLDVVYTWPAQNGVVPLNHTVKIAFNAPIVKLNGQPVDETVITINPSVEFTFNYANDTIFVTPGVGVTHNTVYTVTVSGIKSTCNEPLAQPFSIVYRTVNNNPLLSDLKVNGQTVEGFSPLTFTYNVVLPYGTTQIPVVEAIAQDANAVVVVNQATSLPGTATVAVTAEDGQTTQTYTVNLTVESAYVVTFVVTDGTNPIQGATISIEGVQDPLTTNAQGQATISLPNGTYIYSVTATGYQPINNAQFTVNGADVTVPVTMTPLPPNEYLVTFNVTDGTNPIQGATISIEGVQDPLTTNAQGQATISLPNGTYIYSVTATGYHPINNAQFTVSGEDLAVNVIMTPLFVYDNTSGFRIYPNPTDGLITINLTEGKEVRIYNGVGLLIMKQKVDNYSQTIDLSHLAPGVYTLRIDNETYKIVKR